MATRSFAMVLAGGGARGFAHAGVLQALERWGWLPRALVGVSMGAMVAATYALREDWYRELLRLDLRDLPGPLLEIGAGSSSPAERLKRAVALLETLWAMIWGWGRGETAVGSGSAVLDRLTRGRNLEDGRLPVAVGATDLNSGRRVILRSGSASSAVLASAALAGVLPPLRQGDGLLADGAYADIAPIDVARGFGADLVVAVDPGQAPNAARVENGLQAIVRAMDICHSRHAELRFAEADLVIRPLFRRPIDTLEFGARRECVAAGIRGARACRRELGALLGG